MKCINIYETHENIQHFCQLYSYNLKHENWIEGLIFNSIIVILVRGFFFFKNCELFNQPNFEIIEYYIKRVAKLGFWSNIHGAFSYRKLKNIFILQKKMYLGIYLMKYNICYITIIYTKKCTENLQFLCFYFIFLI